MNVIEIAEGTITIELQPEEAMDLASACQRVLEMPYGGDDVREGRYRLYRAAFEAMAVAGHSQYCIMDTKEEAGASLSALRGAMR